MVVIKMISDNDQTTVVKLIATVHECMNEELKAMMDGNIPSYLDWNRKRVVKDAELKELVDRNIKQKKASV